MSITLDPISLVSIVCAINLLYVAVLSWLEGASLLTARLFAAMALTGAWWAMCLGLAFSEWGLAWPALLQLSQLLSGFFGPLVLLYTASQTGVMKRWSWRWALLLTPGGAGALSILLVLTLQPPLYDEVARQFIQGDSSFDIGRVGDAHPWYRPLQTIHAVQLFANTFAAIVLALLMAQRQRVRRDRFESRLNAVIYATMLIGIVLTNVLPGAGYSAWTARLAPLLPLPFLLTLWHFLRRRIDTAEALTKQREVLLTYLPSPSIDKLLGESGAGQGKKVEAAVLFSDLRGFTEISERVSPESLVTWIDDFFSRTTRVILDELGMVDKLIGDAVLAVFGVPDWLDDPCIRAVNAAERMRAVLDDLNRERPLGPGIVMRMGIGIHFGPLVAGTVGSSARRTYTVFGDTVNAASRIEGLTKSMGQEILISQPVYERLNADRQSEFSDLGEHVLRGRSSGLRLYGQRGPGK